MLGYLRIVAHSLCAMPLLWLVYLLITGDESQLGADPIKEIQHVLGFTAMSILLILFLLGIVFHLLKQPHLQILRRALGLWAWSYVILHIAAYFFLELGRDLDLFLQEITHRHYLIMGILSFFILTAMAISSLPALKQRMGKCWFYVQKLGYYALLFGAIHYYWSVKHVTFASTLYLAVAIFILIWEGFITFFKQKGKKTPSST
ncbi:protein-methionine-sulfoxide reductase heme-binding subunit MsrQ [Pasteurella sp. PK-2025]|uniref:protein-methionine-sulfoxide reductase heme-binding subunit MsrQ n=1 Tax=Pasteurella sp. PK-2025 TaxID=3413133 RepID=UPI003C71955C